MEKFNLRRLAGYLLGLFILSLGIAVSVKSDLGCSPVASVPYAISLLSGLELGVATTLWQSVLVLAQLIVLRREFKLHMLLQLLAGAAFGAFNTLAGKVLAFVPMQTFLPVRVVFAAVSILLIALGVWMYSSARLINLPSEGIVTAIAGKLGKPFHRVKVGFDVFSVGSAAIVCLLVLHTLGSVGAGTIAAAVLVGVVIGCFERGFGRALRRFYE